MRFAILPQIERMVSQALSGEVIDPIGVFLIQVFVSIQPLLQRLLLKVPRGVEVEYF